MRNRLVSEGDPLSSYSLRERRLARSEKCLSRGQLQAIVES